MNVSIIIPTYNEKENIVILTNKLTEIFKNSVHDLKIIVVDDNSPDGTSSVVKKLDSFEQTIFLITRPEKLGLGSAYQAGYDWCKNNNSECIIQMDSDLSHPPEITINLVDSIAEGYDVTIASRYVDKGGVSSWPIHRKIISFIANMLVRVFLGSKLHDNTTGYRAFNSNTIELLIKYDVKSNGFSYLIESIYLFHKKKLKIKEIPFIFQERSMGKTKLSSFEILRFLLSIFHLLIYGIKEKPN
jgi:dolichol-phosphate mannosyltransferase|tara:strand:- start:1036 stop:1767 length:732 start_codon:yes stop_codon:yes gene_type:complete